MSAPAVEAGIRIDAAPSNIYQALTDETALQEWFAEHARVDIDREIYAFSGRYTLGAPAADGSGMTLLNTEAGSTLAFLWRLDGADTVVNIEIEPDEDSDGSNLRLTHSNLSETMPWLVEAFWSMALENLRAYVERGEAGLRFDFANIPYGDVKLTTEIEADPDTVFDALINPSQLDRYMSEAPARIEPYAGGDYDLGWSSEGPAQILELADGERLSYSWRSDKPDVVDTVVTWEVEGSAGRTRLTLVHSGFEPDRAGMDYGLGWLDFVNRIKQLSEVGDRWRKPSIRVNEDPIIRGEGLHYPAAGIHEAVASVPGRVTGKRGR